MVRFILGVVVFFTLVFTAAWFSLTHPDMSYAELDEKYAVSASKFITLESGARVHYLDSGPAPENTTSPPLILIHGYTSSSFEWSNWIKSLRGRYHIIAVDLPAHGLTEASMNYIREEAGMVNFVDEFTQSLNLSSFVLGGSSLGGRISWEYSLIHPEKVDSLILIGADGWEVSETATSFDPIIKDLNSYPLLAPVLRFFDMKTFITARVQQSFLNPDEANPELIDRFSDFTFAPNHRKGLVELALQKHTLDPQRENSIPTLILQGEKDAIVPLSYATKFHQLAPNSTLLTYEMAGHNLHMEAPRRSLEDVLEFLTNEQRPRPRNSYQELETSSYTRESDTVLPVSKN
ncbi:alpha/beta fold hydrolase [Hirschia baltica]|uniref:Alpha/beta hydrolase fold protein n=1 Tax=Hirschia baltica (strain ATCC 49814 / DSM 5838 / IFAM 1418) TaxID=582402 RepID=C6XRV9_HIRBI|nr:alpha/beta hydrolase [Hirschia baltica]ACT60719.1 alpha/beta hydrolase fold protein [Hirschia baltica ATCC 49814]